MDTAEARQARWGRFKTHHILRQWTREAISEGQATEALSVTEGRPVDRIEARTMRLEWEKTLSPGDVSRLERLSDLAILDSAARAIQKARGAIRAAKLASDEE